MKPVASVVKYILQTKIRKTKQNRSLPLSNCTISGKKKFTFFKNQEPHNFNNISND